MILLARLIREEGAAGQDMLPAALSPVIDGFEYELAEFLPEKSAKALRLHSFLAINNMVNGLINGQLLERLNPVDEGAAHFQLEAD